MSHLKFLPKVLKVVEPTLNIVGVVVLFYYTRKKLKENVKGVLQVLLHELTN